MKTLYLPNFINKIPNFLKSQIDYLISFMRDNYNAKLMLVGGAVRDILLGRDISDLDIECYGIDENSFHQAMRELGALGVGKSFFVYKYKDLDISLPRKEQKVAKGHRGFKVELASDAKEASRRRDFTINALMYDIQEQKILDFWGGLEDINSSLLRYVDSNSFIEDSLRVLRAMQFSARLGFRIERDTCQLCQDILLDDLSGNRIFVEFEKLFNAKYLHYGLYALESMGISKKLWGERLSKDSFLKIAYEMAHYNRTQNSSEIYPYIFLTIYLQHTTTPASKILQAINAPKLFWRKLEYLPKLPKDIKPSFVASLAKKEGVQYSPLACYPKVATLAKELDIWDKPLYIGITPKELLEQGFRAKELGRELERYYQKRLKQIDEEATSF